MEEKQIEQERERGRGRKVYERDEEGEKRER